jgi:hypothetical protein
MSASINNLIGDPMLAIAALLSLGVMVVLAAETIHDILERRKVRRQQAQARRDPEAG